MPLPSFFKPQKPPSPPLPAGDPLGDDSAPVQAARTRARRRLIGAVVLLAIGVVVFPMLFETQPRPLSSDIPIELAHRDGQASAAAALPRHAPAVTVAPPVSEPAPPASAPKPTLAAASAPAASAPVASAPAATASEPRSDRFVVQVGAYSDAATLREVRAKVERLGLKTYTQVIETEAGKRTRVRVGPYATRQEADSASSKLKGAGLPGNVLTL